MLIGFETLVATMRLLSICPRIRKKSGRLVASTAWILRLLLLGTTYRKVVVDPNTRTISIYSRYLWLVRRRRVISFGEIQAVTYGYEDLAIASLFSYAHDSIDCFSVGLRLKDGMEIGLFNFVGEGTFSNNGPFPDWLYWPEFALDMSGSQENESRVFVDLLSKMIGVSVVPPRLY
ncbi:MAG: hypothetical protein KatS3mg110_0316 [Pirellulaceae bacterium]|nr:MAG: hypothetical protein KatS3mg110_0316 [Pirellulaceae bacterium]